MGYWNAERDGSSLHDEPTGLIWGDHPADIMDEAISEIVATFRKDWNRNPTFEEMQGGFLFSMCARDESDWQERLKESDPWTAEGSPHKLIMHPKMLNAIPEPQ